VTSFLSLIAVHVVGIYILLSREYLPVPPCFVLAVCTHHFNTTALDVSLAGDLSERRRWIVTQIISYHTQRPHS